MNNNIELFVFLTWDVSLKLWKEKGLLNREIKYYECLAAKGIHITFLTWGNSADNIIAQNFHENINVIPFYEHIRFSRNKVLRAISSLLSLWIARKKLKNCDIIKTNQMWGGWCAVLARIFFRKFLLARTGFELHKFTCAQNHKKWRKIFIYLISKVTYKVADSIYVATQDDKNYVAQTFDINSSKIIVHPNWIDTETFKPSKQLQKEKSILFVGRLTEQKNLYLLFDAVEDMDWTLDIVGDGELKSSLTKYVEDKGMNVNFLGSILNSELPKMYNSYPVFVLPSFYEGNPKTLLEAMACACSVVGSRVDGIKTIISDNETGLLCDLNKKSLQECIARLMGDQDLRKNLGKAARKSINDRQNLGTMVEKEFSHYLNVVKGKTV